MWDVPRYGWGWPAAGWFPYHWAVTWTPLGSELEVWTGLLSVNCYSHKRSLREKRVVGGIGALRSEHWALWPVSRNQSFVVGPVLAILRIPQVHIPRGGRNIEALWCRSISTRMWRESPDLIIGFWGIICPLNPSICLIRRGERIVWEIPGFLNEVIGPGMRICGIRHLL